MWGGLYPGPIEPGADGAALNPIRRPHAELADFRLPNIPGGASRESHHPDEVPAGNHGCGGELLNHHRYDLPPLYFHVTPGEHNSNVAIIMRWFIY